MNKIIDVAMTEVGYREDPANSNETKYGKWFGYDGVKWCAMFVSWVYYNAGFPLGNIGFKKGYAGCQTGVAYFKRTGQITESPMPGDIVFFDWNNDGRYDHTGIYLIGIDDESFRSIEGNTSLSNQSNGGEVMIREREYRNAIFVHPTVCDIA